MVMTADGVIAYAQILPVLYIAVHFTLKGLARLRAITAMFAAASELLLLFNILVGEQPELIVNLLAFGSAALMLVALCIAALQRINEEHDKSARENT